MSSRDKPRSRVIVAVDEAEPGALSLDIAQQLLDIAATELVGIFVEDQRLVAHAASRLAREVIFSGQERSLDVRALERQLRARALEAKRRFEEDATRLGLQHEFQILRGDLVAELVRHAAHAEALIVGVARDTPLALQKWRGVLRRLIAARAPAVLFAHSGWRTGRDIVALIETPGDAPTALATALRLAQRSRSAVTVLQRVRTRAERETVTELATTLAASMNVELRALITASVLTTETLLRTARGARLLVLPHRAQPDDVELIATLIVRTDTPLLVMGEGAAEGGTRRE